MPPQGNTTTDVLPFALVSGFPTIRFRLKAEKVGVFQKKVPLDELPLHRDPRKSSPTDDVGDLIALKQFAIV
jgi:hypothetical protein